MVLYSIPLMLFSASRCWRQYVLSQPVGNTSKDIWPPIEYLPSQVYQHHYLSQQEERASSCGLYGRKAKIGKLLLQGFHHFLADTMLQIHGLVLIAFLRRGVSTNWRDIDHAVSSCPYPCQPFRSPVPPLKTVIETQADLPEFHKRSPLDGNVKIGNVSQTPVDQLLVLVLP